ncbi:hypothetical protein AGOR_G00244220 [Albula goreensis]|uniref:Uncharacterized protein n=1 Tax=Albula goreensis TaxID=1534307 RepID=A0A8T3CJT3_9TELE|nr:hypothetical protein AGOR_G00244220 [Albula goreensis]
MCQGIACLAPGVTSAALLHVTSSSITQACQNRDYTSQHTRLHPVQPQLEKHYAKEGSLETLHRVGLSTAPAAQTWVNTPLLFAGPNRGMSAFSKNKDCMPVILSLSMFSALKMRAFYL